MPGSMLQLEALAKKYARLQHEALFLSQKDATLLRRHIVQTLRRCLPSDAVTEDFVDRCCDAIRDEDSAHDPMHTGAIHAFAGYYLLHLADDAPLLHMLHRSACKLLPRGRAATRDDLRLVTLDALYDPQLLPKGLHTAFICHRLGLRDGIPRSCEEIAAFMHKPLTYIHELETAVLITLSSHHTGGYHA